jgi:FKBP-type peptidyl-prolyl cis-trans isomerase FkpA
MQARSFALALSVMLVACGRSEKSGEPPPPAAATETPPPSEAAVPVEPSPSTGSETMPLEKIDLAPGNGVEIKSGQTALVHYTGWLFDAAEPENKGKRFDSSVGGEPFEFEVGAQYVIKGWDLGVAGMKVGGKRRLVVPPELGYGAQGQPAGGIPPGATLVFDVELVEIR